MLYDDREDARGRLEEYVLGRPDAYRLLCIPPRVWYGFAALGDTPALLCNCPDLPHDPAEALRRDISEIPYRWYARFFAAKRQHRGVPELLRM